MKPGAPQPRTLTAVIGAMREEVELLEAALERPLAERQGPYEWSRGLLEGQEVLIARCGIGKVNAAALTQALLARGANRVLFTGVAGAVDPTLAVGDVVIGADAVQHDVDVTELGYAPGEVPGSGTIFPADPLLVSAAAAAARSVVTSEVRVGRIASGDAFVARSDSASRIRNLFGAAATEMEGAAVAQLCHLWGAPFVIVRVISDNADRSANVDFRAFTEEAAVSAASVTRELLKRLGATTLGPAAERTLTS